MSKLSALLPIVALGLSAPAAAERWQDLGARHTMTVRIDLDALKYEGHIMTYRVEMTYPNDPRRAGRRDLSTAKIDCDTGLRQFYEVTSIAADGTTTTRPGDRNWRKILSGGTPERVRELYCNAGDWSVADHAGAPSR